MSGDADAQENLGRMYAYGVDVPQDDAEAVKWFRRAVEQGHVDAQFNLGVMYAEGRGVPQDDDVAVKLFLSAAVHGHPRAQFRLAYFYMTGKGGVPQDFVAAHALLNAAASQLSEEQRELAVKGRDSVATALTPDEIREAQQRAAWWAYPQERDPWTDADRQSLRERLERLIGEIDETLEHPAGDQP